MEDQNLAQFGSGAARGEKGDTRNSQSDLRMLCVVETREGLEVNGRVQREETDSESQSLE